DACKRNLDCAYGLECVEGFALADGGVASGRTCQFHSFGDCEGDGMQPGPDTAPCSALATRTARKGRSARSASARKAATPSRAARRTATASTRRPATTGSASPARRSPAAPGTSTAPPTTAASMESVNNL